MAYKKPKVVAQNKKAGSFAAGCPSEPRTPGTTNPCVKCELTK